jgi:hypothetical protein
MDVKNIHEHGCIKKIVVYLLKTIKNKGYEK